MMNYAEFIASMQANIKDYLPERFEKAEIGVTTTYKNNSVEKVGLTIREEERRVSPTVYMEEFYQQYMDDKPLEEVMKNAGRMITEVSLDRDPDLPKDWSDYSMFQDKVIPKLINRKMNNRMLNNMPWTKVNDLAEVYMVELDCTETGSATMKIVDQHMEMWGIGIDQLREDAMKNVQELHPAELLAMGDVIESMMFGGDEKPANLLESMDGYVPSEVPMFVLSNPERTNGAECLRYPGVLDQVRDVIGEDFYVLPSSTHEVIITPKSQSPSPKEMGQTVREVNDTQVEKEELLSYNVYEFNKGDKDLKIVNEAKEKTMEMER